MFQHIFNKFRQIYFEKLAPYDKNSIIRKKFWIKIKCEFCCIIFQRARKEKGGKDKKRELDNEKERKR